MILRPAWSEPRVGALQHVVGPLAEDTRRLCEHRLRVEDMDRPPAGVREVRARTRWWKWVLARQGHRSEQRPRSSQPRSNRRANTTAPPNSNDKSPRRSKLACSETIDPRPRALLRCWRTRRSPRRAALHLRRTRFNVRARPRTHRLVLRPPSRVLGDHRNVVVRVGARRWRACSGWSCRSPCRCS